MTYRLFIDDERFPVDNVDWIIARSSKDSLDVIKSKGMPDFISFDHDLGGEDTSMVFLYQLVDYALDNGLKFSFDYYIHSQNPVGADRIRSLVEGFKKNG